MRKFLLPALAFLSSSCYTSMPLREEKAENNQTYQVDYLFEHDGCKVYRFYDRGEYIYFTNCQGEAIRKTDSTTLRNRTNRY